MIFGTLGGAIPSCSVRTLSTVQLTVCLAHVRGGAVQVVHLRAEPKLVCGFPLLEPTYEVWLALKVCKNARPEKLPRTGKYVQKSRLATVSCTRQPHLVSHSERRQSEAAGSAYNPSGVSPFEAAK